MMSNSKTNFDITELKRILEDAYSIGKINAIESITCDEEELLSTSGALQKSSESSSGERLRTSFRVTTDGNDYFLKRVGEWIEESRLAEIEEFIKWTETRKYKLSPSLKVSNYGQTHIAVGENRFQLFDFLQQEKRQIWMRSKLSKKDCTLAGNLLGQVHLASVEYIDENPDKKHLFSNSVDWQESCEGLFQRIKGANLASHPVFMSVAKNEDYLKSRFLSALRVVNTHGKSVVPLLVHGDFHPGNVLFFKNETGSRAVRLVDFDYLRREHPLYDVGYALIMFARSKSLRKTKRSRQTSHHRLDWQLAKAFVRGYFQALRKDPAEMEQFKIRKAEVMAGCLNPRWVLQYMTFACFLIMDWAVEKLENGPGNFSDVYVDVIEMIESLVCYEVGEMVESMWLEAFIE